MKKLSLILVLQLMYLSVIIAQTSPSVIGAWLGELEIPSAKMRMGIVISKDSMNSNKAVLNIIDQATGDIPCNELILINDSVYIRIKHLGIEIAGVVDKNNKTIKSEFRQRGGKFPIVFSHVEKLPELLRPQEPLKPYPYNEEEVVFENTKAGIKLAGTLTYPKSKGKFAAVILVTGSGQQNRNEEFAKHKPFMVIADYLTRNGIAVLRFDDRGVGGSTGNFNQSTSADFADDVLAGISYLKSRKEIDQKKIGIIGHSEGGTIAPLVATMSSDISFIVSLAGFFENFDDVVLAQLLRSSKQKGLKDEDIELERKWRTSIYQVAKEKTDSATAAIKLWDLYNKLSEDEIKRLNWPKARHNHQIQQVLNPWWRYGLSMDCKSILTKVKCPFLAMYGEIDQQVNPELNIPIIEQAMKESGNTKYTVKKLPGLNHFFQTAQTGAEYEYFRIEETISPVALKTMSDWIKTYSK